MDLFVRGVGFSCILLCFGVLRGMPPCSPANAPISSLVAAVPVVFLPQLILKYRAVLVAKEKYRQESTPEHKQRYEVIAQQYKKWRERAELTFSVASIFGLITYIGARSVSNPGRAQSLQTFTSAQLMVGVGLRAFLDGMDAYGAYRKVKRIEQKLHRYVVEKSSNEEVLAKYQEKKARADAAFASNALWCLSWSCLALFQWSDFLRAISDPLMLAAYDNDTEYVSCLIEAHEPASRVQYVNQQLRGQTPLTYALRHKNHVMVQKLLRNGAGESESELIHLVEGAGMAQWSDDIKIEYARREGVIDESSAEAVLKKVLTTFVQGDVSSSIGIEKSYRSFAQAYHPDKGGTDPEFFEAMQILYKNTVLDLHCGSVEKSCVTCIDRLRTYKVSK